MQNMPTTDSIFNRLVNILDTNCGYECSFDAETGISYKDYNYCPNCGAKMDLEGDTE